MAKLEGEQLERLENARRAYEHAWGEAKRYGDKMLVDLQGTEEALCKGLVFREEARNSVKRKASEAVLQFAEATSALLAVTKVMQEIAPPRSKPST